MDQLTPDKAPTKQVRTRRFKRCVLHIGTEKTGTTTIQHHLRENRSALLEHGVLYPKSAGRMHGSQWEFVAAVHPEPWKQDSGRALGVQNAEDQLRFRDDLLTSLEEECDRAPNVHTLLLSSEHFQSRLHHPNHISKLKALLDPLSERFEVLVYFRRQDQMALSHLSTRLKSSVPLQQKTLFEAMNTLPHYYEFDAIYKKWADVFGAEAMKARLYVPECWVEGELAKDFFGACGIDISVRSSPQLNQSLNRKGFQFLQALNKAFPIKPGDRSDKERLAMVAEVSKAYSGKFYPISRAQAEEFYDRYKETNEQLRQLAFPNYPAPLFSEDFSEYPEEAEKLEPDYDDAVEIALHLWRQRNRTPLSRTGWRQGLRNLLRRS